MRRYLRRAEDLDSPLRLAIVEQPEQILSAVGRFGDLESAGWKGPLGTAIHRSNAQGSFYGDVLERFARMGRGRVYELYDGKHLAASQLCIDNGHALVLLKTTYDEKMARLAPGRVLLYRLLEHEFASRHFEAVEFYTDAGPEELKWATGSRPVYHVALYRSAMIKRVIVGSRRLRALLN